MGVAWVCPRCKRSLEDHSDRLVCDRCGVAYPVRDGLPLLLPDTLTQQHEVQLRYFEREFGAYQTYSLENWRLSYIERIFNATSVLEGGAPYLDVGVGGSGATVIEAARRGVEAIGCDLSPRGVAAARRFAREEGVAENASFVVCAAEALPLPTASVGAASAVAVLEHLDDDGLAVGELARVLKPGGRVWITVPHAFRYMPPPIWPLYWLHDRRIGHKRHYDEKRLLELCATLGLEHVQTLYSGHPVKFLQFFLSLFLPAARRERSPLWWRLEQRDRHSPSGRSERHS